MTRQVEFFFDFVSTASYLAWTQLPGLVRQTDAEILYRPMVLGAVMKATGNTPPPSIPAKGKYMRKDFSRFAERYGVAFSYPSRHPVNTMTALRGAVAFLDRPEFPDYVKSVFEGFWVHDQDIEDPEVLIRLAGQAGIGPEEFREAVERQDVKDRLRANTDEAVERGAFGAPTFFVGDEMFFGQDRLEFVAEALQRQ